MAIFTPNYPTNASPMQPQMPGMAAAVQLDDESTVPFHVYVGTAGPVTVYPANDPSETTVAFQVPAGQFVPILVRSVRSGGTEASNLVMVY